MSKKDRLYLLGLVCLFVVFQVLGFLGATQGVPGTSVEYKGWAGYFIPIGAFSLILLVVFILAIIIPAIILKVNDWIEEGKDDETGTRSETTDRTLHQHNTAPITSIPTSLRSGSEDDVQSAVPGCPPITGDQLTRRALRDHVASHFSG